MRTVKRKFLCSILLGLTAAVILPFSADIKAGAAERYDYGDKLVSWVRSEARTQGQALASEDFQHRVLGGVVSGVRIHWPALKSVSDRLNEVTAETSELERKLSSMDQNAAAFERQEHATKIIEQLYRLLDSIVAARRMQQSLDNRLTFEEFSALGLGNVGRATLMESFFSVSESVRPSLPEVYFGFGISVDEAGNVRPDKPPANGDALTSVALGLTGSGNPYASAVGVGLIVLSLAYQSDENRQVRENIADQNRKVRQAFLELATKLPTHEELYQIYLKAVEAHRAESSRVSSSFTPVLSQLEQSWKTALATQFLRAKASSSVLTQERLDNIAQNAGGRLFQKYYDIALALRLSDEIDHFSNQTAVQISASQKICDSLDGVDSIERLQDSVREGLYLIRALTNDSALALVHDKAKRHVAGLMKALSSLDELRPIALKRQCDAPAPPNSQAADQFLAASTALTTVTMSARSKQSTRSSRFHPASRSYTTMFANALAPGVMSCAIRVEGRTFSCSSQAGQPYENLVDSGSSNRGILIGRNDGGFSQDVRNTNRQADKASNNIRQRINNLRETIKGLKSVMPEWTASVASSCNQLQQESIQALVAQRQLNAEFTDRIGPVIIAARQQMDAYVQSPFSRGSTDDITASVLGRTDGLPQLPKEHVTVVGPTIESLSPRKIVWASHKSTVSAEAEREELKAAKSFDTARIRVSEAISNGRQDSRFATLDDLYFAYRASSQYISFARALSDRNGEPFKRYRADADRVAQAYLREAAYIRSYAEGVSPSFPKENFSLRDWKFSQAAARQELEKFIACTMSHGDNPDLVALTPCNIYSYNVMQSFYGVERSEFSISNGGAARPMLANELFDYVSQSDNWAPIGDATSQLALDNAVRLAVGGQAVIASWRNNEIDPVTNKPKPGHVAVILPALPTYRETRPEYTTAWGGNYLPQVASFSLEGCKVNMDRCFVDKPLSHAFRIRSRQFVGEIVLFVRKYP